jgi:hypothetical protein
MPNVIGYWGKHMLRQKYTSIEDAGDQENQVQDVMRDTD